jgi:beta-glucanase (GH16 family)
MLGTQRGRSIMINDVFDNYHNYTLEWTPTKINVFLDNIQYFSYVKESSNIAVWPFDNEFNIIINTAVVTFFKISL